MHRHWSSERAVLNDPKRHQLTTAERFVLIAIEVHIAGHAEGWPTQRRIALQTGLSERQVRRCIGVLVKREFLRVRVVLPGGVLPSGEQTDCARNVYALGPCLEQHPRGRVVPLDADSMSVKGIKIQKIKISPPLPPAPPEPAPPPPEPMVCEIGDDLEGTKDTASVLAHWQATLWPDLRGRLEQPKRVHVILARLAEGFTAEELRWAVDAAAASSWHRAEGQRHRLMVEVLFGRSETLGELVAQGRRLAEARERQRKRAALHLVPANSPPPPPPPVDAARMLADVSRLFDGVG